MSSYDIGIFILEAYKLLKKKDYKSSAAFIESVLKKYRPEDDTYLRYLLALNYSYLGNFTKVQNNINLIRRVDPNSERSRELEAYLLLKGSPLQEIPLVKYLELSEKHPRNKKFKKVIELLRKSDDFNILQKELKLKDCVTIKKPSYRRNYFDRKRSVQIKLSDRLLKLLILSAITVFIIFFALFLQKNYNFNEIFKSNKKFKLSESLPDFYDFDSQRYPLVDKKDKSDAIKFYNNEDSLKKDLLEAEYLIKNKKYNRALILYNVIDNSNANLIVKEKVKFYKSFILNLDFNEKNTINIEINELIKNPFKYNGVLVELSGVVKNIKKSENKTRFNVYVNEVNAEVYVDYLLDISEGDEITIKSEFKNTINKNTAYFEGFELI